jgi:hypothetical protein
MRFSEITEGTVFLDQYCDTYTKRSPDYAERLRDGQETGRRVEFQPDDGVIVLSSEQRWSYMM